ncbi:MAG: M28 family peptidase [Planctomycetota bacterium]|jgi:hypothetical protein
MYKEVFNALERLISGENIKAAALELYNHDRWFTFPEFHKSAAVCLESYRNAGLDVEVQHTPADGKTKLFDYVMPMGWDVSDAELAFLQEGGTKKVIASYQEQPMVLFNYSAPTPEEGLEAELVYIPDKKLLGIQKLSGCVVLLHDRLDRQMEKILHDRGAIGVISDWKNCSLFSGDGITWENYSFFPDNPFSLFGFSISSKDSEMLIQQLEEKRKVGGNLKVHVSVQSKLYEDEIELVCATLPGETDEEVIGYGHLYEAGAWDNAGGAAVIQEAARVLTDAVQKKLLPRPKRSIKFLNGFECYGTAAYLANHHDLQKIVAGINVDGVGIDMFERRAPLSHFKNPESNPSFVDNLLDYLLEQRLPLGNPSRSKVAAAGGIPFEFTEFPLTWKNVPFGGCDSLPADPCFNIPFPGLVQFDKNMWHNSSDTPDKLNQEILAEITLITAAYLYYIANCDFQEVLTLNLRIQADFTHFISSLSNEEKISQERLDYVFFRHEMLLTSLSKVVEKKDSKRFTELLSSNSESNKTLYNDARAFVSTESRSKNNSNSLLAAKAAKMVPERIIQGILTLESLNKEERYSCEWGPGYQVLINSVMWIDGKRSILEIYHLLKQETGEDDIEALIKQFEFLERHVYIKIKKAEPKVSEKGETL